MRGVLSSSDLQAKREFQDLAYRLLKIREEMQVYFVRMPDVQRDVVRMLESTSALMNRVDSLDSSVIEVLRNCESNLEQLIRRINNSLEYYAASEHPPAERTVRILEKIIGKLRNHEDAINKRGSSRIVAA